MFICYQWLAVIVLVVAFMNNLVPVNFGMFRHINVLRVVLVKSSFEMKLLVIPAPRLRRMILIMRSVMLAVKLPLSMFNCRLVLQLLHSMFVIYKREFTFICKVVFSFYYGLIVSIIVSVVFRLKRMHTMICLVIINRVMVRCVMMRPELIIVVVMFCII